MALMEESVLDLRYGRIVNANFYHATGVRVRELPITLDKLLV